MTFPEDFLHFVWQHLFFDTRDLRLTTGESLQIIRVGEHNVHSGPDFLNARVKIADLEWTGQVEIHIRSSHWNQHKHQEDPAYNGVILHVVFTDDAMVKREDGSEIPTLTLDGRIDQTIEARYREMQESMDEIVCAPHWALVPEITKINAIEKSLMQRQEKKAGRVQELLEKHHGDWDEVACAFLAENFGFKLNKLPFQLLVESVQTSVFRKLSLFETEAILFGQAGLLSARPQDDYHQKLKKEFDFQKKKYGLSSRVLSDSIWKFGRLRPANFPTKRIAQFAAVISQKQHLFRYLTEGGREDLMGKYQCEVSPYWQTHHRFGDAGKKVAGMGKSSMETLLINTTVPLLVAYGKHADDQQYVDRAIDLLTAIRPENNRVTRKWDKLGYRCTSSAESQGVLELFQASCSQKKCLWCNIGMSILDRR